MPRTPQLCPCGRTQGYEECCAPFHQGKEPGDPETLMRSRFSAYCKGDWAYLWRTLHPSHDDRGDDFETWSAAGKKATKPMRYRRLAVLDVRPADEQGTAQVLFFAVVSRQRRDTSFVERSFFSQVDGAWRYVSGDVVPAGLLPKPIEALNIAAFEALIGAK